MRATPILAAMLVAAARCAAQIDLVASCRIPSDTPDRSGLPGDAAGIPSDRFGGAGSAIAWTGETWRFIMLTDRGPADGAAPYRTRFHTLEFTPRLADHALDWRILSTTLLTDESGATLIGLASAINPSDRAKSARFDPEGARLAPDGTLYISDEYGPWVDAFDPRGRRTRRFPIPAAFLPAHEDAAPEEELPPANTRGRQPNRGFEGLALTPDGATLWAILQSPLIQDGAIDPRARRTGVNVRVLALDIAGGPSRQFVYALENPRHGVNEILALDASRAIVLERDGQPGEDARFKRLFIADFSGATDVTTADSLPPRDLPTTITPARKRPLLDLLDPAFGLAGKNMPEKVEGLAFGPDLPDGRKTLFITTDNDFKTDAPTCVWVFAIDPAVLK